MKGKKKEKRTGRMKIEGETKREREKQEKRTKIRSK